LKRFFKICHSKIISSPNTQLIMVLHLKVSFAFVEDSPADKVPFGNLVISKLTTNAGQYPDLPHTLVVLGNANTLLQTKLAEAATGDHSAEAALRAAEKDWDHKFVDTGKYVNYVAKGVEQKIVDAGYKATKAESHPAQIPIALQNFDVEAVKTKGRVEISANAMHEAEAFLYIGVQGMGPADASMVRVGNQVTIDVMGTKITVLVDTHRKAHFDGLNSSQPVMVVGAAVNRAGVGPLTDPMEVTPQ
jgi:hypothetical protein